MINSRAHWRSLLCALLIALLALAPCGAAYAVKKGDILVVSADYTRMRARPQPGAKVVERVAKGKQVKFIKESNGWAKVKLPTGKIGFIYKTFLSATATNKVGKLYASKLGNNKLKVFSRPSKSSKVYGRLKRKTTMVLLETKGSWGLIRIVSNGKVGYVKLSNLRRVK